MEQIPLAEAKARLSSLIAQAQAGEEFVITRHGQPMARLVGEVVASSRARIWFYRLRRWHGDMNAGDKNAGEINAGD